MVLGAILIPQAANPLVCGLGAVSWDGGGDGTQWTDPLNWDNDTVPGPTDDVCIDTGTPITVNVTGTQAVQSLVSTDNIVINSSTSLTLTNQSEISGDLSLGGPILLDVETINEQANQLASRGSCCERFPEHRPAAVGAQVQIPFGVEHDDPRHQPATNPAPRREAARPARL